MKRRDPNQQLEFLLAELVRLQLRVYNGRFRATGLNQSQVAALVHRELEWFNVSGGLDAAPDWGFVHRHLMREGFAWVGVSAQKVGVEGGGFAAIALPLKKVNPERYGSLSDPGDAFAFDVSRRPVGRWRWRVAGGLRSAASWRSGSRSRRCSSSRT